MSFFRRSVSKPPGVFVLDDQEKIQGTGGNAADRIKRLIAARAREALIDVRENFLPDIPLFVRGNGFDNLMGGDVTGRFPGKVAEEEKPASRLAPLVLLSVLAGFILLRVFK